jgi:hypothetical protein
MRHTPLPETQLPTYMTPAHSSCIRNAPLPHNAAYLPATSPQWLHEGMRFFHQPHESSMPIIAAYLPALDILTSHGNSVLEWKPAHQLSTCRLLTTFRLSDRNYLSPAELVSCVWLCLASRLQEGRIASTSFTACSTS